MIITDLSFLFYLEVLMANFNPADSIIASMMMMGSHFAKSLIYILIISFRKIQLKR